MVSLLCTPDFTEIFAKTVTEAKIQIKFYSFLHCRPIFYAVRLYVMTKMNGRCLKEMTTSTMCHDEPKLYLNLVNFNIECDSM